ncbi:formyltransferase family protein [Candidatus Pelagibacter sp. HIMB1623]|uniref:formyltransferase family protein n=1 Tax=Candidatus Pelagibacter sp. HIMB1623 TaxID=3413358 RepID=UPI003F86BFA6
MRIVFIGTVEFSKRALQRLIELDARVVGVCTKKQSNFNSDFADLRPLCKKKKIPIKLVKDINSKDNYDWIKSLNPDIIFCFGWSNLLKKKILTLPPMGVLGFHPSKLPKNRGRHPLIWALALGLKKSASTFFFMDEGADSGTILSQKEFKILPSDDAKTLYNRVVNTALIQLNNFLSHLEKKTYRTIKQNHKISNTWRKRTKADGKIDFRMTSQSIYNLVRALTKPYVGAHISYKEKEIIVWRVEIIKNKQNNIESGKVLDINGDKILVKTYDGAVRITNHEFKKLPNIGEYL